MDLKGILSVSGYGGLFKLIKQSKSGFIVESLVDNKRMQAFATSKISTLEEIAIYTESNEVHLKEVLRSIFKLEEGKPVNLGSKSTNEEYKAYFGKVLPDYDKERVYVSDIKKVVTWYNLLLEKGMVDLEEDKEEAQDEQKSEPANVESTEEVNEKETKKETKKTTSKSTKKAIDETEEKVKEKKTVKKTVKKDKKDTED